MSNGLLEGRTTYITGAGSGIGRATALLFAKMGARVVAVDLNLDAAAKVASEILGGGGTCRAEQLDVSDADATRFLVDRLEADGWMPDIVVNNAGMGYIASFLDTEPEEWRRTLNVNVVGLANGCREFARRWNDAGVNGHLVNVSSMASVTPVPSLSAYTASKYAVEGMSDVLALELPNIDVTCIHPGVINTPIVRNPSIIKIPAAQIARIQEHYVKNGDTPELVAEAIVGAIKSKSSNVYAGKGTGLVVMLKRLLPRSWFRGILRSEAKKIGYLEA